jgi:PadR family transcriptional regulator PadR
MGSRAQMLKGLLEGCILELISRGETYGYEITEYLNQQGFTYLNEGSVYPVLMRLETKKLVTTRAKKSVLGPMRKYFYITSSGKTYLTEFRQEWNDISSVVSNILKGGGNHE